MRTEPRTIVTLPELAAEIGADITQLRYRIQTGQIPRGIRIGTACQATLELYGTRGQRAPRLHWEYDLAKKRNVWLPPDNEQARTLAATILSGKRMTQAELVKEMANCWKGEPVPGVNALRHMLADMEGEVVTKIKEGHNRHVYSLA